MFQAPSEHRQRSSQPVRKQVLGRRCRVQLTLIGVTWPSCPHGNRKFPNAVFYCLSDAWFGGTSRILNKIMRRCFSSLEMREWSQYGLTQLSSISSFKAVGYTKTDGEPLMLTNNNYALVFSTVHEEPSIYNKRIQIPFPRSILLPNMPSSDSAIEGLETSARLNDVALVRGCAVEALGITTSPVFAWILPFGKDEDLCGRDHKARVWLTKIDDADRFKTGKFFAVRVWR